MYLPALGFSMVRLLEGPFTGKMPPPLDESVVLLCYAPDNQRLAFLKGSEFVTTRQESVTSVATEPEVVWLISTVGAYGEHVIHRGGPVGRKRA